MLVSLPEVLGRYEAVIGLEVHAQLLTRSKLFSSAPARFDGEHPNRNIEPYSLGMPGVLPVLNRRVVEMAIRTGLALDCQIRSKSIWARKHYFYPDLPKGYQISQYDAPICEHGHLDIVADEGRSKRVSIHRIHMEEDAGKSVHVQGAPYSLVDYNRAGVPLLEIVSGPDLSSPTEASRYLKALRAILMTLEVCDGNMQEGSFRCDANVSIRPRGQKALGTRCEIKNVNSFRYVEQAIEIEILRHARMIEEGRQVEQETRLFDSEKKQTRSMRSKEEAHDYRYFPDPDLPPLVFEQAWIESAARALPELPAAKIERYLILGLADDAARTIAEERALSAYFDRVLETDASIAVAASNFLMVEILRELKDDPTGLQKASVGPADLAHLVRAKETGKISSTQQKKIFQKMWLDGGDIEALLAAEGEQVGDAAVLEPIIDQLIADNPKQAEDLRAGKTKLMGFFVGQVMKATKGKANPQTVNDLLTKKLGGS